jgi:ankyrin repeat protein
MKNILKIMFLSAGIMMTPAIPAMDDLIKTPIGWHIIQFLDLASIQKISCVNKECAQKVKDMAHEIFTQLSAARDNGAFLLYAADNYIGLTNTPVRFFRALISALKVYEKRRSISKPVLKNYSLNRLYDELHARQKFIGEYDLKKLWQGLLCGIMHSCGIEYASRCEQVSDIKKLIHELPEYAANRLVREYPLAVVACARAGYLPLVKLFVEKGVDVNIHVQHDEDGLHGSFCETPLIAASQSGHLEVVKFLLESQADTEIKDFSDGETALHKAAGNGYIDVVRLLCAYSADIEAQSYGDENPLFWACQQGNKQIAQFLIDKGSDVNAVQHYDDNSIVAATLHAGHYSIVRLLVAHGAHLSSTEAGVTPLVDAVGRNIDAVKLLLELQADPNETSHNDEYVPLIMASSEGCFNSVQLLLTLKDRLNINIVDYKGNTALIEAARNSHKEIIELLLESDMNIDVDHKNDKGETAFSVAHNDEIKELIEQSRSKMFKRSKK